MSFSKIYIKPSFDTDYIWVVLPIKFWSDPRVAEWITSTLKDVQKLTPEVTVSGKIVTLPHQTKEHL